jgi:hypothetical protein
MNTDSFVLFEDYPDPFLHEPDSLQLELDSLTNKLKTTQPAQQLSPVMVQTPPEVIDISFIRYLGMLTNTDNRNKTVAFIRCSEKEVIVKKGQLIDGVLIKKILPGKLLIHYKKKDFVIQKESI